MPLLPLFIYTRDDARQQNGDGVELSAEKVLTLHANRQKLMELRKYLTEDQLVKWQQLVGAAQNIVVLGHAGPDGDAIGSILAMTHYLKALGKHAVPMTPNPCPDFLRWMPGIEEVVFAKHSMARAKEALNNADLVVCLDFSGFGRLEDIAYDVESVNAPVIVVDHHLDPQIEADLMVSDPQACATCEILFSLFCQIGAYETMSKAIATCLYCGLMTDTGAFAYNSNRPEVYMIVSMLIAKWIDKDRIYRHVYYSYTESRLRLMGYLMNEKLIYFPEEHASVFALTCSEMRQFNFIRGDAEGFVNLPLQIKGTKLSISLREDTEKPIIRVSLRSVDDFPCNKMAEDFFNGGGHLNAAGGSLPKPMSQALETVRNAINAYREKLI